MAPLALEVTERPKVNIEVREATTGRVGPKIHGALVLSGERHGRPVSVRLGSGEVSPHSEVTVRLTTPEFKAKSRDGKVRPGDEVPASFAAVLRGMPNSTRWKKLTVEGGPEGIVIARKGGAQADWLCDLWLAERSPTPPERLSAGVLDLFDRGVGRRRELGIGELDADRQLDVEVTGGIDAHAQAPSAARAEHVAAATAVLADEVEVVAADLDPLGVVGEAEAEHRSRHVDELEDVLLCDDLRQRSVGRALARHGTSADELEAPVDADRAGGGAGRDQLVELREQLVVLEWTADLRVE
jgi:hypothetical protein